MPDTSDDTAVEPVETAQAAVEPIEPTSQEADSPTWDGPYDESRARRTIDHLRGREAELEKQAKEFERLQNDPDAFRALAEKYGYEIPEDEPEADEPEAEPFRDPRVDQLLAEREQERRNHTVMEQAAKDVTEIQSKIGRDLTPDELESLGALAIPDQNGIPRVSLAWEKITALQGDWQKQWIKGKKSPTPPQTGSQGSEKFDIRDPEARVARMQAIMDSGD